MDRPGPHDYSPDKLKVLRSERATGWGRSRTTRSAGALYRKNNVRLPAHDSFALYLNMKRLRAAPRPVIAHRTQSLCTTRKRKRSTSTPADTSTQSLRVQVPGPGEYELQPVAPTQPPVRAASLTSPAAAAATASAHADSRASAQPPATAAATSSFATKVLRETQRGPPLQRSGPGPGQYFTHHHDAIRVPHTPTPKEHQFFNSTQRRNYEVDPMKLLSAPTYLRGPGPGAYTPAGGFERAPIADPTCSAFSSTQVCVCPADAYAAGHATKPQPRLSPASVGCRCVGAC